MSRIKPVFRCEEHLKAKFSVSTCLLTISVGQEVHEGEKFSAILELVEKNFEACIMMVDDTLQRHTIAISTDEKLGDALMHASRQAGDAWLLRNQTAYSKIKIPFMICRWDQWLKHENFALVRSMLKRCYDDDLSYKDCFDETIDSFLSRYSRRDPKKYYVSDERIRALCLEYLLEECAAMCLWSELKCEFEVYPNCRNVAMEETHRRFILPHYPELLHAVRVKFKNSRPPAAQKFEF